LSFVCLVYFDYHIKILAYGHFLQGSHASLKVLESTWFYFS